MTRVRPERFAEVEIWALDEVIERSFHTRFGEPKSGTLLRVTGFVQSYPPVVDFCPLFANNKGILPNLARQTAEVLPHKFMH